MTREDTSVYEGECRACREKLTVRLVTEEGSKLIPPPHILAIHQCQVPVVESWMAYRGDEA